MFVYDLIMSSFSILISLDLYFPKTVFASLCFKRKTKFSKIKHLHSVVLKRDIFNL